jgi:hypothetical protein
MAAAKSLKVPKGWEDYFAGMTAVTDKFCAEHLDGEYADLARHAIAALCRKRPSPLASGAASTWACAVLYALGQINYLSDKASKPHMTMADLAGRYGVSPNTASAKAKLVRKALGMHQLGHPWMRPSLIAQSPLAWLVEIGGLVVDARALPAELRQAAADRGLIPHA